MGRGTHAFLGVWFRVACLEVCPKRWAVDHTDIVLRDGANRWQINGHKQQVSCRSGLGDAQSGGTDNVGGFVELTLDLEDQTAVSSTRVKVPFQYDKSVADGFHKLPGAEEIPKWVRNAAVDARFDVSAKTVGSQSKWSGRWTWICHLF